MRRRGAAPLWDFVLYRGLCRQQVGFLIFGFYCTSKKLLVKESLLVKVRQQVKKDLVKNMAILNEAGLIKL